MVENVWTVFAVCENILKLRICHFLARACSGGAPATPSSCGASRGECLGERPPACQRGKL